METALRVLELLSLLLVRLLHLELKLLAVVVGDERGRDQPVRVQLRGREDHLVRRHEQELVLQVLLLLKLLVLLKFTGACGRGIHGAGHVRRR